VNAIVVAQAALGQPVRDAAVIERAPIAYDPYLAGRKVERVVGVAGLADGSRAEWHGIVKRTAGPGLRAARRELAAYRSGLADPNPVHGLRAPKLLAWEEGAAHVEIWLEQVRDELAGVWPVERFGLAARHIAAFDAWAAERPLPPDFDSEDAWAERHGQPERVPEALTQLDALRSTPGARDVMGALDDDDFRRTGALIASTQERIDILETFTQTPLHHDLVRSNLFALDDGGTAAIDWENVGRGPRGVDLAPLVVGSVRRGEASSEDLGALEQTVLDCYIAGLRGAGVERDDDFREAYRLALGLRWHVVIGAIGTALDPAITRIRGSRPNEPRDESVRHLLAVAHHLLDAG
jgi:Phosphotransferase enzyme family